MKWVKATERLPLLGGIENKVIIRGKDFVTYGFKNFNRENPQMYFVLRNESFLTNDVEWLDESEHLFENEKIVGEYFIVENILFNDYMKDEHGKIKLYDTLEEAAEVCGIYEFPNVLVCKIKYNHVE